MIEKRYYNATTLKDAVAIYEREYGMSSADFYEAHQASTKQVLAGIPGFQRSVWAGLWQELRAFDERDPDGGRLADHLCRGLQPA